MRVTRQMIEAARRGEYDYLQRKRLLGVGTPTPVIRPTIEAALVEVFAKPAKDIVSRVAQRRNGAAIAKQKVAKAPVVKPERPRPTR